MNKENSKILRIVSIIILLILITKSYIVFASDIKVEAQTSQFYVNDFADIFTEEQEQQLMQKAVDLAESYNGIQVVVTTVNSLEGNEPEQYAYAMYNQYRIGKDSMGILILLSVQERQVRIETGFKMQAYITDSLSGRILDKYGMEYLKENKFAEGLISIQNATIDEIRNRVPNNWYEEQTNSSDNNDMSIIGSIFSSILSIILFIAGGIGIIFVVMIIYAFFSFIYKRSLLKNDRKWKTKLKQEKDLYNETIKKLKESESDLIFKNSKLKKENNELSSRISRIEKLHPKIDEEIEEMIENEYRTIAKKYDLEYEDLQSKPCSDNDSIFLEAINAYESLPDNVKKYVKTDICILEEKVEECQEIIDTSIAENVCNKIQTFLNSEINPNYNTYLKIVEVYNLYEKLTKKQKTCFKDKNLINNIEELKEIAKKDYESYIKAKDVEQSITNTLENVGVPDRYDIDILEKELKKYKELTDYEKNFIPIELYEKLIRALEEAKADEEEYYNSDSNFKISSSNFKSSGNHSGFDGHSSGGGAGRSF